MSPWTEAASTLSALRRVLLAILLLGMVGTTTELLLLKHDEDATQLIPLILLGAGYAAVAWNALRRTRLSLTALQIVMVCFIVSGLLGMMFHYQANIEFQLEMDPQLVGSKLLWQALQAKTPPALAPGVMAQLGLTGLAYAFRYPAMARGGSLLEENANEL
jgi:hypothetical protein